MNEVSVQLINLYYHRIVNINLKPFERKAPSGIITCAIALLRNVETHNLLVYSSLNKV
jgi:hypothetical protein